jgi:hypothetical protein
VAARRQWAQAHGVKCAPAGYLRHSDLPLSKGSGVRPMPQASCSTDIAKRTSCVPDEDGLITYEFDRHHPVSYLLL